jgi:hypothetical protein
MKVDGQSLPPAAISPGKIPFTHFTGGREAPGSVWTGAKISTSGLDPRTVQPVASHHSDCHIPAHISNKKDLNLYYLVQPAELQNDVTVVLQ